MNSNPINPFLEPVITVLEWATDAEIDAYRTRILRALMDHTTGEELVAALEDTLTTGEWAALETAVWEADAD